MIPPLRHAELQKISDWREFINDDCRAGSSPELRIRTKKNFKIFLCSVGADVNLKNMLKISNSPFPQSLLSYVAFRVAFRETFESLSLHKRCFSEQATPYGYLCEIPFLQEVAPAVQLDLLATVWHKHLSHSVHEADLVEESVVYAACEMTARFVERDPSSVVRMLANGPLDLTVPLDSYLARELRLLYLELPNDGDFLLISQFLDLEPEEAIEQKLQMGVDPNRMGPMFDVLGRWHVSPQMTESLRGLLTDTEIARVATTLGVPCLT